MDLHLTRKELELLKSIYEYINSNRKFPDNNVLAQELNVETPRISRLKKGLRQKGFLEGKQGTEVLTTLAINYLKNANSLPGFRAISSTYIPLIGEVSAGKGERFENLAVFINDGEDFDLAPNLPIPNLQSTKDNSVVALKVKGISMESVGILDGDFVIIELKGKRELWGIKNNQIIVARYLPENEQTQSDEDINLDELPFNGYTLKVYKGEYFDFKGKYVKLGRFRDYGQKNPHEIKTRAIRMIGKVIGVYRDIK
jgi:SOS-response transcriptional repressor LexA